MEISRMLIKPYLQHLKDEFKQLEEEVDTHLETSEIAEFKSILRKKTRQLEMLTLSVEYLNHDGGALNSEDLYASFRRLKLELRFARRKWKRFMAHKSRLTKIQESKHHVSSYAA